MHLIGTLKFFLKFTHTGNWDYCLWKSALMRPKTLFTYRHINYFLYFKTRILYCLIALSNWTWININCNWKNMENHFVCWCLFQFSNSSLLSISLLSFRLIAKRNVTTYRQCHFDSQTTYIPEPEPELPERKMIPNSNKIHRPILVTEI